MTRFTDAKGDAWDVAITGATIKRALDLLKIDLGRLMEATSPDEPPLLTRLDLEVALLVDVLFVVCLPQAEKRGITDKQFAEHLDGEALYRAHEALLEGLADFFQSRRRTDVVRAIQKQREVVRRAVEMAGQTIASDEFDAAVESRLAELGESFASLLQSPASTQSREPSGN